MALQQTKHFCPNGLVTELPNEPLYLLKKLQVELYIYSIHSNPTLITITSQMCVFTRQYK
jgi:hypothetical protein